MRIRPRMIALGAASLLAAGLLGAWLGAHHLGLVHPGAARELTLAPARRQARLLEHGRHRRAHDFRSCALEDRGQALAAADAHRFQRVAAAAPVQLAQHRGQDAHARRADGVSQRDA